MDKILKYFGIIWSLITFIAGGAFFIGGEYEKWETVKDRVLEENEYEFNIPIGAVIAFADAPTGEIKVDCSKLAGNWVEFNAGDGKFILGAGKHKGNEYMTSDTGGDDVVKLTIEQMPRHKHNAVSSAGYNGYSNNRENRGGEPGNSPNAGYVNNTGNHTHPVEVDHEGSSQPHPNMPPYIVLTYCKKI